MIVRQKNNAMAAGAHNDVVSSTEHWGKEIRSLTCLF